MAGAYKDPNQTGWSGTPFGVAKPDSGYDVTMKQFMPRALEYGAMGLLNDNSRLRERVEGPSRAAPGRSYASRRPAGSGMAPRFQGGNTPSNPGGKNWDTFDRNVRRVTDTAVGLVKFRIQDKRMSLKKTMTNYENAMASWDPSNSYNMAYSAAYGAAQPSSAPKGGSATNTSQKTRNPARKSTGPKINSPKP